MGKTFSGSDIFLIIGGLFLLFKGTMEIHNEFEQKPAEVPSGKISAIASVITQIALMDIIFSLDSILTAIGLVRAYWIMATAIIITIILMMVVSEPLCKLVNKNPTLKMLALSFLLLIGMVLIADGFSFHVPRAYIYFAVFFSVFVEVLNRVIAARKKVKKR